jgi:predicted RNA-binding Zn-ribbon protein involved in translation (DUF1610 family)
MKKNYTLERQYRDEKKNRHSKNREGERRQKERKQKQLDTETVFRCANCGMVVDCSREYSGVNNRNHCPNCLWSLHVDLQKAGDRKAECHARMRPIGLTLKHSPKKYQNEPSGELMIIHECAACGKISINRIAADDSPGHLLALYESSLQFDRERQAELAGMGIQPLSAADITTVFSQLFGWQAILEEFSATEQSAEVQIQQSNLVEE